MTINAENEHGWHPVPQREIGKLHAITIEEWRGHYHEAALIIGRRLSECLFVVVWLLTQLDSGKPQSQPRGGAFRRLPLVRRYSIRAPCSHAAPSNSSCRFLSLAMAGCSLMLSGCTCDEAAGEEQ
jgi:hypothetical protein